MTSQELLVQLERDGHIHRGTVASVRFDSDRILASLEFPEAEAPELMMADVVAVEFEGGNLAAPLGVSGRVIYQARENQRLRYQLVLPLTVSRVLGSFVNRREAVRVCPSVDLPVTCEIPIPDRCPANPTVNDISATGISLLICEDDESRLFRTWQLLLFIQLPEPRERLELVGIVRYRRLNGAMVFYGLEFDAERSTRYERKQEAIARYVIARQAQLLSVRRRRRESSD